MTESLRKEFIDLRIEMEYYRNYFSSEILKNSFFVIGAFFWKSVISCDKSKFI